MSKPVSTKLDLSPEAEHALNELKQLLGIATDGEVFRRSLGSLLFLAREKANGGRIIVQQGGGSVIEITKL